MKNNIFLSLALCFALVSCVKVTRVTPDVKASGIDTDTDVPYISMVVSASGIDTKAEVIGEDRYNENLIKTVDYFLYQSDAADENAVIIGHVEDLNSIGLETIRINVDENLLNSDLMPRPYVDCIAYVIVNKPADLVLPDESSAHSDLETVRKLVASTNFSSVEASTGGIQPSFLMEGIGNIYLIDRNKKVAAKGTVNVSRLASKHTVAITIADQYDDNGDIWTPDITSLRIKFSNAVSNTALTGVFEDNTSPVRFSYFGSGANAGRRCEALGTTPTKYMSVPFYSYASEWEFNSKTVEPYFMVVLSWSHFNVEESRQETKPCYYKVLLKDNYMDSNCWYHINLSLSVLGSFIEDMPSVVANDNIMYYVFDWCEALKPGEVKHDVEAAINDARYLMVPETEHVIDNVFAISIPFLSSHTCKIVNTKAWHEIYDSQNGVFKRDDLRDSDVADWFHINGSVIEFEHALNNNFESKGLDTTPYHISFRIQHKDDVDFFEDVTIVQSPAVVVSSEGNTSYGTGNTGAGTRGDVYVNGQERFIYGGNPYYNSIRTRDGVQYMYIIETKVLPANSNYILRDPRCDTPNQIVLPKIISQIDGGEPQDIFTGTSTATTEHANPGIATAPATDGTTRKMQHYYATLTTEESRYYISPKFRIASNFCSAGAVSKDVKYMDMVRRCASYQEFGYPAGRWRLPTYSELEYIAQLQRMEKVPQILTSAGYLEHGNNGYFYSTGAIGIGSKAQDFAFDEMNHSDLITYGHSIRCVYDDWYWENEPNGGKVDKATFTWGDKEK